MSLKATTQETGFEIVSPVEAALGLIEEDAVQWAQIIAADPEAPTDLEMVIAELAVYGSYSLVLVLFLGGLVLGGIAIGKRRGP